MKDEFKRYEKIYYNTNTKGSDYEKVLQSILTDYLGSRFEFHTRAQIIDAEMEYIKFLQHGSNELDVVGIFYNTTPKIVLKMKDHVLVPYDAVALISEVKFHLNKTNLEKDELK
jgi:hypothetical protein